MQFVGDWIEGGGKMSEKGLKFGEHWVGIGVCGNACVHNCLEIRKNLQKTLFPIIIANHP